ncbi:hypothetical protein SDC9_49574 [bioreactor metagenome]|uniref:DUF6291 domain-containing protein n=1 Tax=bioreactor metagenome TaxID=1076179 RepID=A0A644WI87_9ZZZZ|nr:DUF6291 domain-containing protein [Macellibacteroides fermentans]
MTKKSFVLYNDNYEPIESLSQEEKGDLLDAIFLYHINGAEPNIENKVVRMAFLFFRSQFERDNQKYSKVVERNKINGNKGGRPKKETQDNPNNPVGFLEPKKPDNDNDNDSDNDNDKIKNNISESKIDSENQPKTDFDKFNCWIKENTPHILKIKNQISEVQYNKLKEKYSHTQIENVLIALGNYKEAPKKYVSVYFTFLKWAEKEFQGSQEVSRTRKKLV